MCVKIHQKRGSAGIPACRIAGFQPALFEKESLFKFCVGLQSCIQRLPTGKSAIRQPGKAALRAGTGRILSGRTQEEIPLTFADRK